jgi:hypothetical protein
MANTDWLDPQKNIDHNLKMARKWAMQGNRGMTTAHVNILVNKCGVHPDDPAIAKVWKALEKNEATRPKRKYEVRFKMEEGDVMVTVMAATPEEAYAQASKTLDRWNHTVHGTVKEVTL